MLIVIVCSVSNACAVAPCSPPLTSCYCLSVSHTEYRVSSIRDGPLSDARAATHAAARARERSAPSAYPCTLSQSIFWRVTGSARRRLVSARKKRKHTPNSPAESVAAHVRVDVLHFELVVCLAARNPLDNGGRDALVPRRLRDREARRVCRTQLDLKVSRFFCLLFSDSRYPARSSVRRRGSSRRRYPVRGRRPSACASAPSSNCAA